MRNGPDFTDAVGFPLRTIVDQATGTLMRIVIDRTGLTGRFTFKYEWSTDPAASDGRVSYVTALQEQLGLKLESERVPVDVLVVDSVARPTPN